ncbi:MAG: glycoside hydrolase family 6 protein [Jatrophihabitantaceae bacterium]
MTRLPLRLERLLIPVLALATLAPALAAPSFPPGRSTPAAAMTARAVMPHADPPNPTNPLAARAWGNYLDKWDSLYAAYSAASGTDRTLLGALTLQPRMRWWGAWTADDQIYDQLSEYIRVSNGGNPNVLVQFAIFRLQPWEGQVCGTVPTQRQRDSYKYWINEAARAIGSAHTAIVLQPDLPFAFCSSRPLVSLGLVSYAAQKLSALPNTSVYLDAGAYDWRSVANTAWMLRMAGVRYARGFALNATHFDSTPNEIWFGAHVVNALYNKGVRGKHFVVNTDENQRPFKAGQVTRQYFNDVPACTTRVQRYCSAVGIPPTTDVANARWGLPPRSRGWAARLVDAYMWIGRPWLSPNTLTPSQFVGRALNLARWRGFR